MNEQLNDTVSQIEQVQASIDDTQSQIDAKQAEIADKQDVLAGRISSSYKTGGTDFLSVLLNSSNFEELTNNLYYMGKINASDEQLINDVKRAKAEFDSQKAQLESQKSDLEQLKEQQSQELAAVQAKQDEASSIVANLSDDVRALMEKRDAEILAAAEEEKRQAAAAEAARKAAAAASSNRGSSGVSGTVSSSDASSKGQAIVNACYRVGSPGSGLCAMWVSQVYSAAGYGYPGGNANNMYWNFCTSSNKGDLQPGMIVAVSTWTGTSAGRLRARGHLHRRRHGHAQRRLHPDHGARHLDPHLRHLGHPALGLGRLAPIEHQGPLAIRSGRPFSCGASETQQSPHRHPNQPRHSIMEGWYGRG